MDTRHIEFMRKAIEKSKQSAEKGNFPAGAVVVKDGAVIAEAMSSPFPSLFHADSKAMSAAFEKMGALTDATVYVGLEPCLMCISVAYWAGVREIYYVVPKSKVSSDYYETPHDTSTVVAGFNEPVTMHHIGELEEEALAVIREWESHR